MKYFIILLLTFMLYGCYSDSVYNYKEGVIVEKYQKGDSYIVSIRYKTYSSFETYYYHIYTTKIPRYEYDQFELGDTIK